MGKNKSLFGKTPDYENSRLAVLSVPWSVTASFGEGADKGPEMIALTSSQMDFFSIEADDVRDQGIFLFSPPAFLKKLNKKTRKKALPVLALEESAPGNFPKQKIEEINQSCQQMVKWVYEETKKVHIDGKKFGLMGGDHSCSEGAISYFNDLYKGDFGILHIDAHADLRKGYQGFHYSHASVMYNIMTHKYPPKALLQIGVRDYCKEEYLFIKQNNNIHTFFDSEIKAALFEGKTWKFLVDSMIQCLPEKIYISVDVDGLQPYLFPNTGTPVPGGLSFEQTIYLLHKVTQNQHDIIGFDLVETAAPHKKNRNLWDAQTGARLLYKLCQATLK